MYYNKGRYFTSSPRAQKRFEPCLRQDFAKRFSCSQCGFVTIAHARRARKGQSVTASERRSETKHQRVVCLVPPLLASSASRSLSFHLALAFAEQE